MNDTKRHKRVLLKISGEQLAGEETSGIDANYLHWLSGEIKKQLITVRKL